MTATDEWHQWTPQFPFHVQVWDVASGKLVTQLAGHTGSVTRLEFSPDGRLALAASVDGTVRLWTVPRWNVYGTWSTKSRPGTPVPRVYEAAFTPDSRYVLTDGGQAVVLLEVASLKVACAGPLS